MIRRLAILLLVCGGLAFFLQREQARGSFDAWERRWLERVQQAGWPGRAGLPAAPPVVLIELRQGDLPFESWPPAPLDYALVFESLVRHRPRQVVVHPLLDWPALDPLDAASLAERIALLPRGVLACTLERGTDGGAEAPAAALPLPELPLPALPGASGDVSLVPDFSGPGQVPSEELRLGKPLGFTRIEWGEGVSVEGDTVRLPGDVVRLPLLARRGDALVPSLALQALLAWYEAVPGDVMTQLGRRLTVGSVLELPIDDGGRLRLAARLAPPLRRLDAGALLIELERDGALMAGRSEELETLRSLEGALVVLGETGESTPRLPVAGAAGSGWTEAEILARSLVAALSGFHLREPPVHQVWAGWGGVVLVGAALLACPRRWVPVFALGGAASLVLGGALAFLHGQWWIPPVPPLALWLAASLVAFILPAPPVLPEVRRDPAPVSASPVPAAAPSEDPVWEALAGELARDERPAPAGKSGSGETSSASSPGAAPRSAEPLPEPLPAQPPRPGRKGHRTGRGPGGGRRFRGPG